MNKTRRVYDFPTALVERISDYQKRKSFRSEVETVRYLLYFALSKDETFDDLIGRYVRDLTTCNGDHTEVARRVLVGHPHIQELSFAHGKDLSFVWDDGESGALVRPKGSNQFEISFHGESAKMFVFRAEKPVGQRLEYQEAA